MPRVHHVKKARKDNPAVKKGEPYYWWKFAFSPKRFSKTRPRASQLTQSDKLSRYYEAQETIEDLDAQGDIQSIIEVLQEVAENIQEIADEYQEGADNILSHFEVSSTAEECEEKSYACESTAISIEEAISELENLELSDDIETVPNIISDISWEL